MKRRILIIVGRQRHGSTIYGSVSSRMISTSRSRLRFAIHLHRVSRACPVGSPETGRLSIGKLVSGIWPRYSKFVSQLFPSAQLVTAADMHRLDSPPPCVSTALKSLSRVGRTNFQTSTGLRRNTGALSHACRPDTR